MTNKRKAYEEKLDAQVKEWSAEIALLKAKAENAQADVKVECVTKIDALQQKSDIAKAKLHELKGAGDETWEDLKTGVQKAWKEVNNAFHDIAAKFK